MEPTSETRSVLGTTNIHLDFHTPTLQREIGVDFDSERFAKRLDEANVDSITFFAKCHHGNAYYDTAVDQRHPNLDFDLLEEAVDACHRRGIEVLAYYTLTWDNLAGKGNPDWFQRDGDGKALEATERDQRWDWLCLNSPYLEERVLPQVRELLEYDVDGFWFDILMYHEDACTCRYCRENMRDRGLDPADPDDRRIHRTRVCDTVAERLTRTIKDRDDDLVVTYNHPLELGLTTELASKMDYVVIESIPSGWGYLHTPMYARYTRNLDRPVQGMTGAFHDVWGDFGTVKSRSQLRYELSMSLAHHLPVSIGDQLRPRGELEPAKYETIGDAFEFAKERALPPAEPIRDVAVVYPGVLDPTHANDLGRNADANGIIGATKLLCEAHHQFDVLDERLAEELLSEFQVVVLPDAGALHPKTVETIRSFVADGGSLVAAGDSSLDHDLALGDVLGVSYEGQLPYSTAYMDLEDYDDGIPDLECVSYGSFASVTTDGATPKAAVIGPTTERSETRRFSHYQAPPERDLDVPAITHHEYGDGEAVYIGTDLFTQYFSADYYVHRAVVDNILRSVGGDRVLAVDSSANVEGNVMRANDHLYVHLTNFYSHRAGASISRIDDIQPATDIGVEIVVPGLAVDDIVSVTDADVTVEQSGSRARFTIDSVDQHEIVRLDP